MQQKSQNISGNAVSAYYCSMVGRTNGTRLIGLGIEYHCDASGVPIDTRTFPPAAPFPEGPYYMRLVDLVPRSEKYGCLQFYKLDLLNTRTLLESCHESQPNSLESRYLH